MWEQTERLQALRAPSRGFAESGMLISKSAGMCLRVLLSSCEHSTSACQVHFELRRIGLTTVGQSSLSG